MVSNERAGEPDREAGLQYRQEVERLARLTGPLSVTCPELEWTFYYRPPFLHMYVMCCEM